MAFAFYIAPSMSKSITNVLSIRCKIVVEGESANVGVRPVIVKLDEAQIKQAFSQEQLNMFKSILLSAGSLMTGSSLSEHKKTELANKIKITINEMIHNPVGKLPRVKYSHFISKKLNYSYNYLTTVFAEVKGITIENFIIQRKIERVKELIHYGNLTFTEIAFHMQYSSISHLSSQFKRIIGLTLTQFKSLKQK